MNAVELKSLTKQGEGPCVSLFMPVHKTGRETQQNPIRLKNLLSEAEERLTEIGMRPTEARDMLSPGAELLEREDFWRHQSDGLAVFMSRGFFRSYRLPLALEELLVVTDRFHVKPLLPLLTEDGKFFILALSQNDVRLMECTRFSASEIDLEGTSVPRNIETALKYDDPEKQRQFHTDAPTAGGRWSATFHGHGVVNEVKDDLRRYFQQIDRGLRELLKDERAPLVLAGVDYLLPMYVEINSYPHVVEEGITGNPDGLRPEDLQEQAWTIVEPGFLKARDDASAKYRQMLGTGLASHDLQEVVASSHHGRVETLFVAVGVQIWGIPDPYNGTVEVHTESQPEDEDLLDFAAVHTLLNGGTVFAVEPEEVPDEEPVAAIFRY